MVEGFNSPILAGQSEASSGKGEGTMDYCEDTELPYNTSNQVEDWIWRREATTGYKDGAEIILYMQRNGGMILHYGREMRYIRHVLEIPT